LLEKYFDTLSGSSS
jgi:hypothetical protein